MKWNFNSKSFILLGIIIVLSSLISNFIFDAPNCNEGYYPDEKLRVSKASGKIHIDGNAGWASAKTGGICTGNGTYSEPYVIEDLVIDVEGSGWGILIESSTVYFRIVNCTFSNPGFGGIRLRYVDNGQIINNTANNNIYYGISLTSSNDNIILGNTANNNNYDGIQLEVSNGNNVSENTANENNLNTWSQGISLSSSNDTIITGNTVNNNIYGMNLYNSHYNIIEFNVIEGNDIGIYLMFSNNNEISDNIFNGNNVNIQGYAPVSFRDILIGIIVFIAIASFATSGVLYFTQKRSTKNLEMKYVRLIWGAALIGWGLFESFEFAYSSTIGWGFGPLVALIVAVPKILSGFFLILLGFKKSEESGRQNNVLGILYIVFSFIAILSSLLVIYNYLWTVGIALLISGDILLVSERKKKKALFASGAIFLSLGAFFILSVFFAGAGNPADVILEMLRGNLIWSIPLILIGVIMIIFGILRKKPNLEGFNKERHKFCTNCGFNFGETNLQICPKCGNK